MLQTVPTVTIFNMYKAFYLVHLFATKHHAMKAYWEIGVTAPRILHFVTTWR
jgi:hypothetical protein